MDYFYILPLKDQMHIKIGISSDHINRIITHQNGLNIDTSGVLILNCRRRSLALKVESWIKSQTKFPDSARGYKGLDGWSEIRRRKDLKFIKHLIRSIKGNPYFSYSESKIIDYNLYTLTEWIVKNNEGGVLNEQINKLANVDVLKPVDGIVGNNKDYFIASSSNISDLIGQYSLHLIKVGRKNPLHIFSEWIKKLERGYILDILDSSDKKKLYNEAVELYGSKPYKIEYNKDGINYYIVCDIRLLMLVILSLDYHTKESDYNFLCFRGMLQYLQLDKKLRGSVYKLIDSISEN